MLQHVSNGLSAFALLTALHLTLLAPQTVHAQDRPPVVEPTIADMAYGDDPAQRLDFYRADSAEPTPLVVVIHGGGWLRGDKRDFIERPMRKWMPVLLDDWKVSVASIEYRMDPDGGTLPAAVLDAAQAVQFLRSKADELNLDPDRFVATGNSAGGCTALWLATHDDLADPASDDPVARQSTRLSGAWVKSAQTTIEPAVIREWVGEIGVEHGMIRSAGGFASNEQMDAGYDTKADLYAEYSPATHLSPDDPPLWLWYGSGLDAEDDGIHHARFGYEFTKLARDRGVTCHLTLFNRKTDLGEAPSEEAIVAEILGIARKP